jgi:uncharacterized protein (TIGR00730 family)
MPIHAVTVYCSSSKYVAPIYFHAATELGTAIARAGWRLVYGGNRIGVMGALADAARSAGGTVIGVTPRHFLEQGLGDDRCHDLLVTENMRDRKALLEQRGDAFVVLPGGIGTLEEFFEILVGKSLGLHDKPIVLLNLEGFYDPLLAMIEHGLQQHFIRPPTAGLYHVALTVADAVRFLADGPIS